MQSPVPVHIVDPVNFWLADVVPIISTFASIFAAVAAIWAVRAAHHAKMQYLLAESEAQAASEERNKKPLLFMIINGSIESSAQMDRDGIIWVTVAIENFGEKPATHIVIDIDLPLRLTSRASLDGLDGRLSEEEEFVYFDFARGQHATKTVNGVLIMRSNPLYVGQIAAKVAEKTGGLISQPTCLEVRWRIASAEGAWAGACALTVVPSS